MYYASQHLLFLVMRRYLIKMNKLFFTIILFSISSICFAGGGWTKAKNQGYLKLSQNYIGSNSFYNPNGEIIDITKISLYTTSFYAEYGIAKRFTGILYVPFFVRSTLNKTEFNQSKKTEPGDQLNSIGDADIGIQYGIITDKPIVLSAYLFLGLPFGETAGGNTQILQSGDGEFNQLIRFDASHSFYPKPIYVSVNAGFNNRTKGFSDEVRFGAELGFTLKKFIPILKINSVYSLFNGNITGAQNGIFSNNTEYFSPSIELNYQFTQQLGISGASGFALSGRNILAAPNLSLGAYLKF